MCDGDKRQFAPASLPRTLDGGRGGGGDDSGMSFNVANALDGMHSKFSNLIRLDANAVRHE